MNFTPGSYYIGIITRTMHPFSEEAIEDILPDILDDDPVEEYFTMSESVTFKLLRIDADSMQPADDYLPDVADVVAVDPEEAITMSDIRSYLCRIGEDIVYRFVPGKYFARSADEFLGPFNREPTSETLPPGATYFVFQEVFRVYAHRCSVFRYMQEVTVPETERPRSRLQLDDLEMVVLFNDEFDGRRINFRPAKYLAVGSTSTHGPYSNIPAANEFAPGVSYLIVQEIAILPSGRAVYREIMQLDC